MGLYDRMDEQKSVVLSSYMQTTQLICLASVRTFQLTSSSNPIVAGLNMRYARRRGWLALSSSRLVRVQNTLRLDGSLGRGGASEQLAFPGPLSPQSVRIIGFP